MSMEKTIIYLKAEQSSYVDHETIHIGDIASVYCGDKKKEEKIRNIILYEFDENKEKEGRIFLSILLVIEKISEQIPCGEVRNVGELDMVVYYKSKNAENKKWVQTAKILFIGATCFFGTGITVMGYNNDVDMAKVFGQLYRTFVGQKPDTAYFCGIVLFHRTGIGSLFVFQSCSGKKSYK